MHFFFLEGAILEPLQNMTVVNLWRQGHGHSRECIELLTTVQRSCSLSNEEFRQAMFTEFSARRTEISMYENVPASTRSEVYFESHRDADSVSPSRRKEKRAKHTRSWRKIAKLESLKKFFSI